MAVATDKSNLVFLVDMHSIGLVRVKECLTFFTFDTPYPNAFVILTDNTLTAVWIDETGGDGVRLLDMFTHITLGMVNMVTKLKLPSNLLCGGWRVRKGSGLLTVLISQRHIERVLTKCAPSFFRRRKGTFEHQYVIFKSLNRVFHGGNYCMQRRDLFKKVAMSGTEPVLVRASITKLANLVEREKIADLRVPFVARLGVAVISLACFFQVPLLAFLTKLAVTKLEVFAK